MLARARAIVDELHTLTANLCFSGADESEDDDIKAYADMVEARTPLVEELAALRGRLTDQDRATPEYYEIISIIADIADMDAAHRTFFEELRDEVRGLIKEIRQGQKVNLAYGEDDNYDMYSRIDKKQ